MCKFVFLFIHRSGHGGQKRALDSLELELKVVVSGLTWVLGTKLGPLQEQQIFLIIEPSLQFLKYFFTSIIVLYMNNLCASFIYIFIDIL